MLLTSQEPLKIYTEAVFSAAHFVHTAACTSPCLNLHGHTWRIIAEAKGFAKKDGMVIDYRDIKSIINQLDHKMLLPDLSESSLTLIEETEDSITVSHHLKRYTFPKSDVLVLSGISVVTSENLALYLKHKLSNAFKEDFNVRVYEGNSSYAEI